MFRKIETRGEGRCYAALLLSIALIQIAAYYFCAAIVNGAGSIAVPQPDTLLYCQSARRICEGHAFSFSAGSPVSTGTTSVLYPFILAIPYALGFTGGSLITVGFWLNAFFYLIFLFSWKEVFREWLPTKQSNLASLLLVLFPQTAFCAMAQSDTGLWMAVSGLSVLSLVKNRPYFIAPLLCLGPWVRPEGVLLIVAFAIFAILFNRRQFPIAIFAICSAIGVFIFNASLTGAGGFSSVAHKGYFATQVFPLAIKSSAMDLVSMANEIFLSCARSFSRNFYFVPLLGSVVCIIGLSIYEWRERNHPLYVFILAAVAGMFVVAQSGWQGSNSDRYLAWLMPLFIFFSSIGWCWLHERLNKHAFSRFLLVVPLAYAAFGSITFAVAYHLSCDEEERNTRFAKEIDRIIPSNASIGAVQLTGLSYYLGDRKMANLSGIYSPEYAEKGWPEVLEILKNEPETRFDYWLMQISDKLPATILESQGETLLAGPDASELKKARWDVFQRAATIPNVAGKILKCRVDVGYAKDERRSNYETVFNYGMRGFLELMEIAPLNGGSAAYETGRLIVGYDEMSVDGLEKGLDVIVVMRVADFATAINDGYFGDRYKTVYSFKGKNDMHIEVDGVDATCSHFHLDKEGFTDITLKIPGRFITETKHRVRFHGDHAAFGYWYFQ